MSTANWPTWREATEHALYAGNGFYRRARPEDHFHTSVGARYAGAMLRLLSDVDGRLGRPAELDVVDVGAGSGRLLSEIARQCPGELRGRLRLTAVEVGARPNGLADGITWADELPDSITGLVVANEWLDNVPVEVVEQTQDGPRLVLVDPVTGAERLGGPPKPDDLAWLARWWPLGSHGERAEVGLPRDEAWASVIRRLTGVAVAADYDHRLGERPPFGTLTGYRDGRVITPVPDGSCDLTAHVALDACESAGIAAGATESVLTTQRKALRALGVLGERPPISLAHTDPRGYLRALRRAGEEAELIDRAGLGGFGWLVQSTGGYLPVALTATMVT